MLRHNIHCITNVAPNLLLIILKEISICITDNGPCNTYQFKIFNTLSYVNVIYCYSLLLQTFMDSGTSIAINLSKKNNHVQY